MTRIVLDIQDDERVGVVLSLVQNLEFVVANVSVGQEKVWTGNLPVFCDPVKLPEFRKYTREELHDRQSFC